MFVFQVISARDKGEQWELCTKEEATEWHMLLAIDNVSGT